ncbi:hypothetical protein PR202_ga14790 [Eleusine coracana subsp. coracana]|uniref:NAD-dependent epimerase/dehydratase domain-containing protein n=1 Tax=Eleusine coracana subsp. coracana TaxID=191504 RepID=A0AAV5CIH2_ELECO|nr:hypothetical protein PR202_ga14790 [Eleusine coracana subsp. coracana]
MEERNSGNGVRACVTGGAGFIGSWLVKKLLERGYTVHATLRDTGDEAKAGLLRRLVPGAAESGRLALFNADLYDASTFAPAIAGCRFVFLVATPFQHDVTSTKLPVSVATLHGGEPKQGGRRTARANEGEGRKAPKRSSHGYTATNPRRCRPRGCRFFLVAEQLPEPPLPFSSMQISSGFLLHLIRTQYTSTAEATLDAAREILKQCAESKTVQRVIHVGSMASSSPLKAYSTGFKDVIDESCWTPLKVDYPHRNEQFHEYTMSKLLSEKEFLAYNESESPAFEVVTVPCALVAGDTIQDQGHATEALECAASPVTRDELRFGSLRMLQRLTGSVPLVHVNDVCDALVFCMEQPSMAGRFLCAAVYPTLYEIVGYFADKYPHLDLLKETEVLPTVQAHSDKFGELGFRYKYGMKEILDGSIQCAVRFGSLDPAKIRVQE